MELYDCESKREIELRDTELEQILTNDLISLAESIEDDYLNCVLENEIIVVNALTQIAGELGNRCRRKEHLENAGHLEDFRFRHKGYADILSDAVFTVSRHPNCYSVTWLDGNEEKEILLGIETVKAAIKSGSWAVLKNGQKE